MPSSSAASSTRKVAPLFERERAERSRSGYAEASAHSGDLFGRSVAEHCRCRPALRERHRERQLHCGARTRARRHQARRRTTRRRSSLIVKRPKPSLASTRLRMELDRIRSGGGIRCRSAQLADFAVLRRNVRRLTDASYAPWHAKPCGVKDHWSAALSSSGKELWRWLAVVSSWRS
jgi:hypothetical protein